MLPAGKWVDLEIIMLSTTKGQKKANIMFSLMCGVSGGLSGDREVHGWLLGKGRGWEGRKE